MTAPDLIAQIPDLIAARIKVVLPALRSCEGRAGRFDVEALAKLGVAAPAVLVSTLRIAQGNIFAGMAPEFTLELGAFVVTKDAMGLPRDAAAATICQTLLSIVPETNWGVAELGAAQGIEALPLITSAKIGTGVSLWAVTWRQPVTLVTAPPSAPLPLDVYWGQAPAIGAANEADYEQVTP